MRREQSRSCSALDEGLEWDVDVQHMLLKELRISVYLQKSYFPTPCAAYMRAQVTVVYIVIGAWFLGVIAWESTSPPRRDSLMLPLFCLFLF